MGRPQAGGRPPEGLPMTALRRMADEFDLVADAEAWAVALPAAGVRPRRLWRCGASAMRPSLVVAVPACDEESRIQACLEALAATLRVCGNAGVLVFVNNTTDATASRALATAMRCGLAAVVVDAATVPAMATAGWARRMALDLAAHWAPPDGVLMTTDADGRADPEWARANLSALAAGADLVCGRIEGDPLEAARLPAWIHGPDAVEAEYWALSVELDARIDPRPHDPWPHHGQSPGASLVVRAHDYLSLGRLPTPDHGEDRAFAAVIEAADLRVRHSNAASVTVSCRVTGRARGGMADCIAARIADRDSPADELLRPAAVTARRAAGRRALRVAWEGRLDAAAVFTRLRVPALAAGACLRSATFGAAWARVEAASPAFESPRLHPSDLVRELPLLRRLVTKAMEQRP